MKFLYFLLLFALACTKPTTDQPAPTPDLCTETITVDFEPAPFGNVVQTIPYQIPKEPMGDAFVGLKFNRGQIPWRITFFSENVTFLGTAEFEDYTGTLTTNLPPGNHQLFVELYDTVQAHNFLMTYQQLIAHLEIDCYNP